MRIRSLSVLVVGTILAVVGCSGNDGGGSMGQGSATAPGGQADAFTNLVSQVVSTSPDDAEPSDVNPMGATTSETAEPALF